MLPQKNHKKREDNAFQTSNYAVTTNVFDDEFHNEFLHCLHYSLLKTMRPQNPSEIPTSSRSI